MGSRRRRMMRLQAKMQKEEERQKKSKRRLAPNYEQRLKALKMEGTASFLHPDKKDASSPKYEELGRDHLDKNLPDC